MLRVCVFLVSVCVVGAGSLSGRGFFCRDPDTGKLHPVNTTWPSNTFCGKYHCKLRRKNITETEYAPTRQLNVTNIKLFTENLTNEDVKTENIQVVKDEAENVINIDKKTDPDIIDDNIHIQDLLPIDANMKMNIEDKLKRNDTERDRYLTDIEIKTISEMLHTVKKSDLDAIVEIYNLAQDIYKEIDTTSTDHVLDENLLTAKTVKNDKNRAGHMRGGKKNSHVSYWYEPLSSGKMRSAELMRAAEMTRAEMMRNDVNPVMPAIPVDMEPQGSNIVKLPLTTSTKPTIIRVKASKLPPAPKNGPMAATYFNGPLSKKDFGKLPYYYPISNFQRLSSYVHQQQQQLSKLPSVKMTISKPAFNIKPVTYRPTLYSERKYQKEIKPSVLLPYPFSFIQHYNWSYPQNIYHSNNRLNQFEMPKKDNKNDAKNYVEKSGAVLMNPDLENFQDLEVKLTRKEDKKPPVITIVQKIKDEKSRPDWQTDPLPNHILDDVRAHVQEKQRLLRPFPLRKKVKLERVGKLIKLDEMSRSKRSADEQIKTSDEGPLEPELFEVYIERTTCNADYTVPGFFRYGNLSQPFPDCCPQRIATR